MTQPTPTGFTFARPRPPREVALEIIQRLQGAVEQDQAAEAATHLDALRSVIEEWQRGVVVSAAKRWIDQALSEDLLLFNVATAEGHLANWRAVLAVGAADADPDLARYTRRVAERTAQKQAALVAHGVITYCESLLARAAEMERGETSPHPDFMLASYYEKARAIAQAARQEHSDHPELEMLAEKADRIHGQKVSAARLYPNALGGHAYTDALYALNQLPTDMLIPRFAPEAGMAVPAFVGMVTASQARRELLALAGEWANGQAAQIIASATARLDAHDPSGALELLDVTAIAPYLRDEARAQLDALKLRADEGAFKRAQAAERCQHARNTAASNPLDAWDAYAQAHALFSWLPELPAAREVVVAALSAQIDQIIAKTEAAFYEREMGQVRQLAQNTQRLYGAKDAALDEKLARFRELDEMTRQYDEFLRSAEAIYQQVKSLLYDDAVAANDLLSQLESYPELVLLSFPDLAELRDIVNRRLNANQLYGQLFGQLYAEDARAVAEAIESATAGAEAYPDDLRFRAMLDGLTAHHEYLMASAAFEAGAALTDAQRAHLAWLVNADHPDRTGARRLLDQLARLAQAAIPQDERQDVDA